MSEKCRPAILVEDKMNLSVAWAKVFLASIKPSRAALTPLLIQISDFKNGIVQEDNAIRSALDSHLEKSCNTVANTIFPLSLWNSKSAKEHLYERYNRILPLIKQCPSNRYGIYFNRMIAFDCSSKHSNQLDHVISTCNKGNRRASALQVTIFDPSRDHTDQRQRGFPCLQQVIFTLLENDEMAITGVYAHQYLFEKAYGNYLGLCWLGRFVAHEIGARLVQMNCYVGKAHVDITNSDAAGLIGMLENRLDVLGTTSCEGTTL